MAPANFCLKVSCNKENFHKIEGFVEDVCDYYNVFNVYFGNILVSTCEFFSFLTLSFPNKDVEVYSHINKGALVLGFKLQDSFIEALPFLQKNISEYIESASITENERSLLSTQLLSDDIYLDSVRQNVELLFNIKAEAGERGEKILEYLENLVETSTMHPNKKN